MNTKQILETSVEFNTTNSNVDLPFWLLSVLQAEREKTYQDSWCRRGELYSIYPNTARKFDRLLLLLEKPEQCHPETMIDTVVDLGVYIGLWLTYDREKQAPSTNMQFQDLFEWLPWRSQFVEPSIVMSFSEILKQNIADVFQNTVELYMDRQQRVLFGKPDKNCHIDEVFLHNGLNILFVQILHALKALFAIAPMSVLVWCKVNLGDEYMQELRKRLLEAGVLCDSN